MSEGSHQVGVCLPFSIDLEVEFVFSRVEFQGDFVDTVTATKYEAM